MSSSGSLSMVIPPLKHYNDYVASKETAGQDLPGDSETLENEKVTGINDKNFSQPLHSTRLDTGPELPSKEPLEMLTKAGI